MPRAQGKPNKPVAVALEKRMPVVTYEEGEATENKDGERNAKRRKVVLEGLRAQSLDTQQNEQEATNAEDDTLFNEANEDAFLYDGQYLNEHFAQVNSGTVQIVDNVLPKQNTQAAYVAQFVERSRDILQALLSREALRGGISTCRSCKLGFLAAWRCRDCGLSDMKCRQCMRSYHKSNPLHRFEVWTGTHFADTPSWNVGCYVLVPHAHDTPICVSLQSSIQLLEQHEVGKDVEHERMLRREFRKSQGENVQTPHWDADTDHEFMMPERQDAEAASNAALDQFLDSIHEGKPIPQDIIEQMNIDSVAEDVDVFMLPEYLSTAIGHHVRHEQAGSTAREERFPQATEEPAGDPYTRHGQAGSGGREYDAPQTSGEERGSRKMHDRAGSTGRDHQDQQVTDSGNDQGASQDQIESTGKEYHSRPATDHIPTKDILQNLYVRVIHTNGIHYIGMVACSCKGENSIAMDIIACNFMPSSFKRIHTLFTTDLLDSYRLCNLELKSSAYHYYNFLRRITNPLAPSDVINVYDEFRRMTRLWRWLKKLKWAGYGHNKKDPLQASKGELANFCVACPQNGKNIPTDWKQCSENWMYRMTLVADGNFKANHVRSSKPDTDIWLLDGSGMAPNQHEYTEYLIQAKNKNTKAACENKFHAIKMAQQSSKDCDITGKAAIACSRHGCYCPAALVDLFQGEQQKNIDFALLQAMETTGLITEQGLVFIYDIACQYTVHLIEHIGSRLPSEFQIQTAISMFHVHGHKDECFFRFAPSFIPGTAITSGEILESLWSTLNSISGSLRTATLPHREEVLDDHACDSNHKKALGMAKYLCGRHTKAVEMHSFYKDNFNKVNANCGEDRTGTWTAQVLEAEANRRGKNISMDIYVPQVAHTRQHSNSVGNGETAFDVAGTATSAVKKWLQFTLHVEEMQIDIMQRQLANGRDGDLEERENIEQLRESLTGMFVQMEQLQNLAGVEPASIQGQGPNFIGDDIDWERRGDNNGHRTDLAGGISGTGAGTYPVRALYENDNSQNIESRLLCLPSNGNTNGRYFHEELDLRIEQARRHLNQIRGLVADKSFQFSALIRGGNAAVVTRSRQAIIKMNSQIAFHARTYNRIRCRLNMLSASDDIMQEFQFLQKQDVKSSTTILDFNKPGSTTTLRLSWIWHSPQSRFGPNMDDSALESLTDSATMLEFKRVHWLRARTSYQRWREEELLLDNEMQWTVQYFKTKSSEWASVSNYSSDITDGAHAYAARQQAQYHYLATRAQHIFTNHNPNYVPALTLTSHIEQPVTRRMSNNTALNEILQERIFYMESCLRVAISSILDTQQHAEWAWKQSLFRRELEYATICVGIAASLTIPIEVPPMIKAAAASLIGASDVPLDFHKISTTIIPALPNDPWYRVQSYARPWWSLDNHPFDIQQHVVTFSSINECLTVHRAQKSAINIFDVDEDDPNAVKAVANSPPDASEEDDPDTVWNAAQYPPDASDDDDPNAVKVMANSPLDASNEDDPDAVWNAANSPADDPDAICRAVDEATHGINYVEDPNDDDDAAESSGSDSENDSYSSITLPHAADPTLAMHDIDYFNMAVDATVFEEL